MSATHRTPKRRVRVWRWLATAVVVVLSLTLGVRAAYAWSTSQSATAVCTDGVKVNATFTNTEPVGSGLDMVVTATVGSKSGGTKTVKVGATKHFTIDLGVYSTDGGTVTFALKWVDRAGTDTRTASFGAKNCVPANPGPRTVTTDWVDGAKSCATATVAQSRTVTTIPQVWSESAGKYVDAPESEWTSTTESRNRDMTAEEKSQCAGPQPPPQVSYGDWTVAEKSCTAQTVTETQSVTKTPYMRDALGTGWVLDPAHAVTTTETRTRPMTVEEAAACPAPKTEVTAVDGTFANACGPGFNLVFTEATTEGVRYVQTRVNAADQPDPNGVTLKVTPEVTDPSKFVLTNPDWRQSATEDYVACPVNTVRLCGSFVGYPAGSEWYVVAVYQGEEFLTFGWTAVGEGIDLELPLNRLYGITLVVRGPDGTELTRVEYDADNLPASCKTYSPPPEKVAIPTQPASTDRCNPAVGPVVRPAWDPTTDTDKYTWSVNGKGQKVVVLRDTVRTTWSDGTTAPKVFTLPADNGVVCQVPNKDLVPPTVTRSCGGVATVTNPSTNPSLSVQWGDDLVNTQDVAGKLTLAPAATRKFNTSFGTVDLVFDGGAGYDPYVLKNFKTDRSACSTPTPTPTPTPVDVPGDGANGGMDTVSQTVTQPAWLALVVSVSLVALVLAFAAALRRRRSA
jgi:hypothetical protein